MSERQRIVREFVEAFNANDLDRILGFFDPEAVYHNIPLEPVHGPDAIRGVLQGFLGLASRVDWIVRSIAESDEGTVLTERLDRFLIQDRWVELPVMGAFEIEKGKVRAWRDYFDLQQFQRQLPGGA